ncbi:MAG TPA: VWA domain-containing protein, partial [Polyangiaceae bacterium]|nr:VWA domain-containing protein [Polyangiaceae bacterium]
MSRRVLPWTWRSDEKTARLAFWVADAPHHDSRKAEMADALRDTHDVGVHIYAVAASGVDELTEDTMRSAAELTGGRYLFLTNDSGVGGAHKEPEIPCYFATHLDDAILRMV